MLNYVWISLIVIALVFGIASDIKDEVKNTYRNDIPLQVTIITAPAQTGSVSKQDGKINLSAQQFNEFYGISTQSEEVNQPATISISSGGKGTFIFNCNEATPLIWREMGKSAASRDQITGKIEKITFDGKSGNANAIILTEPIRYVKLKAITQAAIDFAGLAVQIAIGLIGVMALWLGLIKIAEEAGLVKVLTKMLSPVTKMLFPDIPSDHPAIGAIIMNTAANMLGLSNAATPIGLKAMEELNKLNPKIGTATNAMVTFLAINTGGLILIPATAIAVRAAAGSTNPGIIIGTSIVGAACATITGILASKLFQRLPAYRIPSENGSGSPKEVGNG